MEKETILARAFAILSTFSRRHPELTIPRIAQSAGLPRATTYRIVNELIELKLLERTRDGRVRTTVRMWELGLSGSHSLSLREAALPFLAELQRIVGHHTQLSVLDGEETLYLEQLRARKDVPNLMEVAKRVPARLTSSGILLASFAPFPLRETIILSSIAERWNPKDPVAKPYNAPPEEVRRLMSSARTQGFVRTDGWLSPGTSGISASIRDREDQVVGAVSMIVPRDDEVIAQAMPELRATAIAISRALGGLQHPKMPDPRH